MLQTHTLNKDVQRYTFYRRRKDRVDKSMFDLFLIRRNVIGNMHDVQFRRGLAEDLLDHMVII